jgi:hypothetical protein
MARPKAGPADAEQQLRELIAEAHGLSKDLARTLRELRGIVADGASQARKSAEESVREELSAFHRYLQRQSNEWTADLNASVDRARKHIIECLMVAEMEMQPDGKTVRLTWKGRFDDQVPLPDGQDSEAWPSA